MTKYDFALNQSKYKDKSMNHIFPNEDGGEYPQNKVKFSNFFPMEKKSSSFYSEICYGTHSHP
jgi:hypothetical protein